MNTAGCGSFCKYRLCSFIRYLYHFREMTTSKPSLSPSLSLYYFPLQFFPQDYAAYLTHRLYHYPFLYRTFHKMHHKYKQPTAFSVTAIHPVELIHMELVLASPIIFLPVHWSKSHFWKSKFMLMETIQIIIFLGWKVLFYGIMLYTYYHGIIDHSGIAFKAQWWQPWQPDAIFHDNHHQYTHVNFGFNMYLWDKVSVFLTLSKTIQCWLETCSSPSLSVAWHLSSEKSCVLRGYFLWQRQGIRRRFCRSAAKGFGRKTIRESSSVSKKY